MVEWGLVKMVEAFNRIKNYSGSNDKIEFAKKGITEYEHNFLEVCFSKDVYGISKKGIAKALKCNDIKKYEDLGAFLEENPNIDFIPIKGYTIKNFANTITQFSGDKQIEMFAQKLMHFNVEEQPWVVRAILKDMRIGFNLSSYNKVRKFQKMSLITPFGVQLCGKKELNEIDVVSMMYAETKYDGERCILKAKNKLVKLTSRSGKDITEQFPEVVKYFEKRLDENINITLDGEIISQSFNDLQQRLGRKAENIVSVDENLKFVAFDVLEYMHENYKEKPLHERKSVLTALGEKYDFETSNYVLVHNKEELKSFFDLQMKNEEEGVVLKDKYSKWKVNDRKNWIKIVPTHTYDLEIVSGYYGNGKHKDVINGVVVKNKSGTVTGKVSSGIDDDSRILLTEMYNNRSLVGSIVEIRYRELTPVRKDGTRSLRFPVFVRIRNDKTEADEVLK